MSNPPGTDRTAVLELRTVAKSFGSVVALADGSVDIRSGEIHALVGENGAGKSTMVKIIAGIYQPDSGQILLRGRTDPLQGCSCCEVRGDLGDLSGTHPVPRPHRRREHLHRAAATKSPRARRSPEDALRCQRPVRSAGRADRPRSGRRRSLDRRPADHRDRESDLSRREDPGHGRADGGTERCRGGSAVRGRTRPSGRRRRHPVHLPSFRRDLQPLRSNHGDARRRFRRDCTT